MSKKIKMLNRKVILITGGTGSFGSSLCKYLLKNYSPKKIIIFSRDELKQYELRNQLKESGKTKLRFFIGDVRDLERLNIAMSEADIVIHAAALKQVDAAEYNPFEAIKTNIIGAQNVISACLNNNVKNVIALSTDKACSPVNLYGSTKLASDKLFISANNIKGKNKCKFSVIRYGNVMFSRGSVIPYFLKLKKNNFKLPVTDRDMTRFSLTLMEGIQFVLKSIKMMTGGELFVPKISSYRIMDLVKAISPKSKIQVTGIRPGEKIHENLISVSDALSTIELKDFFVVVPNFEVSPWKEIKFKKHNNLKSLKYCKRDFSYSSNNNLHFLSIKEINQLIKKYIIS